ncbi:MAG TPA: OmpA family protein [Bacteroidia bacterium]|nr:OmpA family protein [Bacteroidia bacterium]
MKNFVVVALIAASLTSCVSLRKYQDKEKEYNAAAEKNKLCALQLDSTSAMAKWLEEENYAKDKTIGRLRIDSTENTARLEKTRQDLAQLQNSYETLLRNTEKENQKLDRTLKDLETKLNRKEVELNKKEQDLADREKSIEELQKDIKDKQQRVAELQSVLNSKDSAVNALKNTLTQALLSYKDKGLSVTVKNGKVYVSMEEKLLFASGSIVVDKKGKEALLEFAKAINNQPDVDIMIEGHTDNVPMSSGQIKDNWDLSVLRATSILRILTADGKVDPTRIIASGRGEHHPVAENKSAEMRAKNRRTEIILTPKLDELFKILGN